jgi:hypothetical protein
MKNPNPMNRDAVVIHARGCGPAFGILLVAIGVLLLLLHYHAIPRHWLDWWPALIIVWGVWLLVRHYWRVLIRRRALALPGLGPIINVRPRFAPPTIPLLIIAIGAYLLLSNLHYVSLGVIIAALLIVLGLSLVVRRQGASR